MIVAVTGLAREARLVAGPGVMTITSGGSAPLLARQLCELPAGACDVLSIGICGALASDLRVGDVAIASEICANGARLATDPEWTREIAKRLPGARLAIFAGSDTIVADAQAKSALRAATGADVVDMESHLAAMAARERQLRFAAIRVVSDSADRTLPPAARLALHADGRPNLTAVTRSVIGSPSQLPSLIRTAWDAEIAFAALLRCRRALGARLGVPDLGQLALDVG